MINFIGHLDYQRVFVSTSSEHAEQFAELFDGRIRLDYYFNMVTYYIYI